MIGQEKILSLIESATLSTFPRTLMLVGSKGSGKHLLCDIIAEKFNLKQLDITESLTLETIDEINNRVEPYLYIIQGDSISVKEENVILKFLEEPLKNSYIIFLSSASHTVIPTILNRCQIWQLQNYTREQLLQFVDEGEEYLLSIANTPGALQLLKGQPIQDMCTLADKMIYKIAGASLPNTLTITDKIAFKSEKGKFDIDVFMLLLEGRFIEATKKNNDTKLYKACSLLRQLRVDYLVPHCDKKPLFDKFLIELRACMRGEFI